MIFDVHFLPARYGDSIWIEYGESGNTKIILIDGGTGGTKHHIKALLDGLTGEKHLELLVITHIDRDHIEGILSLLSEETLGFTVGAVWFNGWPHLPGNNNLEQYGAVQGEKLTAAIVNHRLPWNIDFGSEAAVVHDGEALPILTLPGGMKITLLSPTQPNLVALKVVWAQELMKANLAPLFAVAELSDDSIEAYGSSGIPDVELLSATPFHEDDAAANGSSIAFLAQYGGKTALFAGDSFPGVLLSSLAKLYDRSVPLDLAKLSHHGSAHNTSPELLKKLDCKKFAISTNGSIYKHPAQETVARVIKLNGAGTELLFNYRTDYNKCWDNAVLQAKYKYTTVYPESEGLIVSLL
jgi:beta-lactamase superfamily II metal-dependent hydrolase